jgi:hypothetical protein
MATGIKPNCGGVSSESMLRDQTHLSYSLQFILLVANMDVSKIKICLDASILVKVNMNRRE